MIIDITGRHVSVTEDLKAHANERLEYVLRHFGEVVSAHVVLDVEKERAMAEMVVHGRHLTAAVHAEGPDLHAAVDRAADKMRVQLEKHHAKRLDQRRKPGRRLSQEETALLAELSAVRDAQEVEAEEHAAVAQGNGNGGAASQPKVVRFRPGSLRALSVDEATQELTRGALDFLAFRDANSEEVGVLYRRRDGNLALVETGVS